MLENVLFSTKSWFFDKNREIVLFSTKNRFFENLQKMYFLGHFECTKKDIFPKRLLKFEYRVLGDFFESTKV